MQTPPKVLLLEGIHPCAKARLEDAGFHVDIETGALPEDELCKRLAGYQALGIRSKTQVTKKVLSSGKDLICVGAFCIGTNQLDLKTANLSGIPVFNAPYSNTRSVAELMIAEMIALSRMLGDVNTAAHNGEWLKSSKGAKEVRGKTLGIVGYGHIGSQVSVLAEAFGMRVVYFDSIKKLPLGNSQPCRTLEDVLKQSDFVSLHVPDTAQTKNMMGATQFAQMKAGAHLINASRGSVVVIPELAKALRSKHVGGAAVDVFPEEPASNKEKFKSELQGLANVILTPHIGGSTLEAQESIGYEVAQSFLNFLRSGSTRGAVNFPNVDLPVLHEGSHRIVNVHRNVPGVLKEINGIVSEVGANIEAQSLSTDQNIGYLVMDMKQVEAKTIADRIAKLETSIKTRVLF